MHYGADWAACFPCADLMQAADVAGLRRRLRRTGPPLDDLAVAAASEIHEVVLGSLLPGRDLVAVGRWPAAPPPAATMPKVRDRLTTLIRGPHTLPLGLDDPHVRATTADSIATARLYWIDTELSELADHAARSLPATTIDPTVAPAPHGLLA